MKYKLPATSVRAMNDVLEEVKFLLPYPVITGGFIRDSILGKKPKDIDVFFNYCSDDDYLDEVFDELNATKLEGATYMPQDEISSIWDSLSFETPVQYIMLQSGVVLEERIRQFDFGFCQCWYNGKELYTTEAFDKDVAEGTMTLTFCEDKVQYDRSMRRAERFKEKYPDRKLVIPDEFSKYLGDFV